MTSVTVFPYSDPPRAEVLVSGSAAMRLNVYRLAGDSPPVLVRGAIRLVVTDPLAVVDYEVPVGVAVVYSVQELDALGQPVANVSSAAVTIDGEGTWLSQPLYPERLVKVEQLDGSFLDQSVESFGDQVRPGGRGLGLWMGAGRGGVRGRFSFAVLSERDRSVVESMFGTRGEQVPPVLCLRSTLAQRLPQPLYIAVPSYSQRGVNWHMRGDLTVFEWDVEETSMPSPAIVVPGYTYQDLEAAYSGAITTNLFANPSAGTDAAFVSSGQRVATRVAAAGASGTGFFRGTSQSGDVNSLLLQTASGVIPGLPYSVSVSVRSTNITGRFVNASLGWRDAGGAFLGSTTADAVALTNGWTRLVIANVIAPAGAVTAFVQGVVRTDASGATAYTPAVGNLFDADSFLLVQSATAPEYFDGSLPGAEWLGAAHASQSYLTANTYRQIELDHQTYSDIERRYDLGGLG